MRQDKTAWEDAVRALGNKLTNRRHYLNPFKLDSKKHLYNFAMTKQEWAAYRFLIRNDKFAECVSPVWRGDVQFPKDHPVKALHFDMKTDSDERKEKENPDVSVLYGNLPQDVRDYLDAWCEYDYRLAQETRRTKKHFKDCGEDVNTWGQLYRLWPCVAPLIPRHRREIVLRQKCKSKLPDTVVDEDGEMCNALFAESRIAESDMIIAEALLLPKHDDGRYPVPVVGYAVDP